MGNCNERAIILITIASYNGLEKLSFYGTTVNYTYSNAKKRPLVPTIRPRVT